jgi:hypothetical protein
MARRALSHVAVSMCACVDAQCFALRPAVLALPTSRPRTNRPGPLDPALFSLPSRRAASPPRDNIPCVSRFLNDPGLTRPPCLLYNTTYTRLRLPALLGPALPRPATTAHRPPRSRTASCTCPLNLPASGYAPRLPGTCFDSLAPCDDTSCERAPCHTHTSPPAWDYFTTPTAALRLPLTTFTLSTRF